MYYGAKTGTHSIGVRSLSTISALHLFELLTATASLKKLRSLPQAKGFDNRVVLGLRCVYKASLFLLLKDCPKS